MGGAAAAWGQAAVQAPQASLEPGALDRAFQRLYNSDFQGSLAILEGAVQQDAAAALPHSVQAATFLFMELDRLHVLESRFFLDDGNMVDGTAGRRGPDPGVRARLFYALDSARRLALARLAAKPDDVEALFALCMAASVETDYAALVEGRTWRSLKLVQAALDPARRLLARTPPWYDAYLTFGSTEYILGDLPFFIRWFVRYDGVQGSKRRGIEQLKLAAQHGRYYGPFARILLAVVSLREKKLRDAQTLLEGLARDFPENRLFSRELGRVKDRLKK